MLWRRSYKLSLRFDNFGYFGPMSDENDYRKTFERFWKPILTDENGNLDLDQIMRELHDFHFIMTNVSKVYSHITNNLLSKCNYHSATVINCAEEHYQSLQNEAYAEGLEEGIAQGLREGFQAAREVDYSEYQQYIPKYRFDDLISYLKNKKNS